MTEPIPRDRPDDLTALIDELHEPLCTCTCQEKRLNVPSPECPAHSHLAPERNL